MSEDKPGLYIESPLDRIVAVHWGAEESFVIGFNGESESQNQNQPGLTTSKDGQTWTDAPIPPEVTVLRALTYASGAWIMGTSAESSDSGDLYARVYRSTDLASWTQIIVSSADPYLVISGLAAGNVTVPDGAGKKQQLTFVLATGGIYDGPGRATDFGDSSLITSTDNGATWATTLTKGIDTTFVAVNFCKDAFFASAGDNNGGNRDFPSAGGSLWRSTDGVAWAKVSSIPGSIETSGAFVIGTAYDAKAEAYAAVGVHPIGKTYADSEATYQIDEVMFGFSSDGVAWSWTAFPGYGPPVLSTMSIAGGGGCFVSLGQRYAQLVGQQGVVTPYYAAAFSMAMTIDPSGGPSSPGTWTAADLDLPTVQPPSPGSSQSFGGAAIYSKTLKLSALGAVGRASGGNGVRRFFTSETGTAWTTAYTHPEPNSHVCCGAVGKF